MDNSKLLSLLSYQPTTETTQAVRLPQSDL